VGNAKIGAVFFNQVRKNSSVKMLIKRTPTHLGFSNGAIIAAVASTNYVNSSKGTWEVIEEIPDW
jgi:predicted esterase